MARNDIDWLQLMKRRLPTSDLVPVNGTRGDARMTFGGKLVDDLVHVMEQLVKDFPTVASGQHKPKL